MMIKNYNLFQALYTKFKTIQLFPLINKFMPLLLYIYVINNLYVNINKSLIIKNN